MNGADLLKGTAPGGGDKADDGKPAPNEGTIALLKGESRAPGSDDPDPAPPKKDDEENPWQKKYEELEKVVGRQGKELGELRKQTASAPKADVPDDIPDAPHPSKFENEADYQKAMKKWVADVNTVSTRNTQAQLTVKEFEKQRLAAGISDDEWDDVVDILGAPENQTPVRLKLVADFLKDPEKVLREASKRIQDLTSRKGTPTSTGTTPVQQTTGGEFTREEVESFNNVMRTPIGRRSVVAKAHEKRFGRLVKPTR